ncbi:uncharacterized protein F4822DRAFT_393710 [Hypoxylon trugodes]|uniref:uncharacterized protein n=1 Tax=Hypoxylon trugodes TaxID=326681 RepID=UPI002198D828|nr:uncharacterized protein F4822DRAFT_393710 [Hypoxylon trugodes]KAI1390611.1 hypothetical protein F4822DRAFT_393710 [Hypoxylon trugodes]
MLGHFTLRHIPPLFVACSATFGGLWPLFNAKAAMLEFGFPTHIANSPPTYPVMITQSIRTSALGLIMLTFYSQQKLAEVDTVMAIMGTYLGVADSYALWADSRGKAVFQLISGLLIGAWGLAGLTKGL